MKKTDLYLHAWIPPILWASLIFLLSAQSKLPGASIGWLDVMFKQTAHFVVYAVLHALLYRAFYLTTPKSKHPRIFWWPMIIAILYAATDEIHQSFIPLRQASWVDIGFDLAGIMSSHYLTHRQKPLDSETLSTRKK